MRRPKILPYTTIDFINTVHLGYTKLIKHKIKSTTRENDAIKRHGKHKVYNAAARITWYTVLQQTIFQSRKSTRQNNKMHKYVNQ